MTAIPTAGETTNAPVLRRLRVLAAGGDTSGTGRFSGLRLMRREVR
ncbi:MAG TPA: hypothetical protein PLG75_10720 [Methanoculleus sp.]|nr:hypothetical protein [Methanoculleus sp.]